MTRSTSDWYGRLDRRTILDAALRIAARPGATELRFRELGQELDADPTAVYRHFKNKPQLMAALIDHLMIRVTETLPRDAPLDVLMRAMAASVLDTFVAHPAIGTHLVDARPVGPGEFALIELSLQAFSDAGLPDDTLRSHYAAFSGMLLAYVAATCRELVTAGTAASSLDTMPWLPTEVEITPESYPRLTEHGAALLGMGYREIYDAGVEVLIESVTRAARG